MLDFLPLPKPKVATTQPSLTWDIFCQVIDNFGDVGVCWRTAAELMARGQTVRLWMDDASALQWMAPQPWAQHLSQGLSVHAWPGAAADIPAQIGDVVIEAFGCEIPAPFVSAIAAKAAQGEPPVWINLEYLSAEDYVERCHRLPSRIMSGPASGMTRWFFYPGFTEATGALVREKNLHQRQQDFAANRAQWHASHGLQSDECAISLFCYEPAALPQLLDQLTHTTDLKPRLLVTPGRATAAMQALLQANQASPFSQLAVEYLQPCPQPQFDEILWGCDLNLVRGEDSLVRALWAGQPMVWHIYPQDDNAHHDKLDAFLNWLDAPDSLRHFHHAWNGMCPAQSLPILSREMLQEWAQCIRAARSRLTAQTGLIEQLQAFVAEKS